ncbi:MAG: hypothetical protein ACHQ9S_18780 [Candidatus Binatia bacterium]
MQDQLVVMLVSTWTEIGTILESNKRVMAAQNQTVKDLNAVNGALTVQMNDLRERYENLRDAYRGMKEAQLKKENPGVFQEDAVKPPSFI